MSAKPGTTSFSLPTQQEGETREAYALRLMVVTNAVLGGYATPSTANHPPPTHSAPRQHVDLPEPGLWYATSWGLLWIVLDHPETPGVARFLAYGSNKPAACNVTIPPLIDERNLTLVALKPPRAGAQHMWLNPTRLASLMDDSYVLPDVGPD